MVHRRGDGEPSITPKRQLEQAAVANKILKGIKIEDFRPECTQYPDVFFPTEGDDEGIANAKRACGRCEIREACLEAALAYEEGRATYGRYGVWGGLTETERESVARKRRRAEKAGASDE